MWDAEILRRGSMTFGHQLDTHGFEHEMSKAWEAASTMMGDGSVGTPTYGKMCRVATEQIKWNTCPSASAQRYATNYYSSLARNSSPELRR